MQSTETGHVVGALLVSLILGIILGYWVRKKSPVPMRGDMTYWQYALKWPLVWQLTSVVSVVGVPLLYLLRVQTEVVLAVGSFFAGMHFARTS